MVMESFESVEQQRGQLEDQVAELGKLLEHWRSWETEYEILREDVESLRSDGTDEGLEAIFSSFEGQVLNGQERAKLLTDDKGRKRTSTQVLNLLRHRLDYVKGNVDSTQKRRDAVEAKLQDIAIASLPDSHEASGLPATEITEELDEHGNIISSSTYDSNREASAIIKKLGEAVSKPAQSETAQKDSRINHHVYEKQSTPEPNATRSDSAQAFANARAEDLSMSLADDNDDAEGESATISTARLLDSIAQVSNKHDAGLGPTLIKRSSSDTNASGAVSTRTTIGAKPVIPAGESAEDMTLRREMLQYSLNEVGSVVAEMDLDDDDESDFEDEDEDDEDQEDQYGRSTRSMIDDDYRDSMIELEKQLNVKTLQNLGPEPGRISPDSEEEGLLPVPGLPKLTNRTVPARPVLKTAAGQSKSVRFAEDLDMSETARTAPEQALLSTKSFTSIQASASTPVAEEVLERVPKQVQSTAPAPRALPKVSRFNATRGIASEQNDSSKTRQTRSTAANVLPDSMVNNLKPMTAERAQQFAGPLLSMTERTSRYIPEGPEGKTHGDVLEREPAEARESGSDDEDPYLRRQALATEYYRKRNAMIQQKGGFQAPDPAVIPIDENGEEIHPKVSRFKAARLAKTGK